MNYPVWQLDFFGGGLFVILIAVFHVYIAHFAVGGGLFLVLAERKGYRENNPAIIEYVRKHARFFLLLTMVAGSITGVGIWFIISLLNPSATSILITVLSLPGGRNGSFFSSRSSRFLSITIPSAAWSVANINCSAGFISGRPGCRCFLSTASSPSCSPRAHGQWMGVSGRDFSIPPSGRPFSFAPFSR